MDYETFGEHQKAESGIFGFLRALPELIIRSGKWTFTTPSEVADDLQPVAGIDCPHAISWADEERDLTAWLGNDLQEDAFTSLYSVSHIMANCTDAELHRDWNYLQASDHFYYMCTKWFSDGDVHHYFNPYSTPYEAFLNYMNVLTDFLIRAKAYGENNHVIEKTAITKVSVESPAEKVTKPKTAAKKTPVAELKGKKTVKKTTPKLKK
jgi:alpha-amylase